MPGTRGLAGESARRHRTGSASRQRVRRKCPHHPSSRSQPPHRKSLCSPKEALGGGTLRLRIEATARRSPRKVPTSLVQGRLAACEGLLHLGSSQAPLCSTVAHDCQVVPGGPCCSEGRLTLGQEVERRSATFRLRRLGVLHARQGDDRPCNDGPLAVAPRRAPQDGACAGDSASTHCPCSTVEGGLPIGESTAAAQHVELGTDGKLLTNQDGFGSRERSSPLRQRPWTPGSAARRRTS